MFQMLSAYSSMQRSLLKKPILATVKMALVVHASVSLYDSSISSCVWMYDAKSSETR